MVNYSGCRYACYKLMFNKLLYLIAESAGFVQWQVIKSAAPFGKWNIELC